MYANRIVNGVSLSCEYYGIGLVSDIGISGLYTVLQSKRSKLLKCYKKE